MGKKTTIELKTKPAKVHGAVGTLGLFPCGHSEESIINNSSLSESDKELLVDVLRKYGFLAAGRLRGAAGGAMCSGGRARV